MAGRKILPDVPRLLQLVDRGMTHQQIAEMFGVSRQAVTLKLKGATTPRVFKRDWPWEVQPRHKTGWLYEAISFYTVSQTKERPLTERQRQRLTSFLDMLDKLPGDYVVDYFPDTAAGFRLRERRASDDPNSVLASADREGELASAQ
ncbi:hypothetical protein [Pseudonocardia sp. NPDC049154]|uniref:hypothetical protein n=1 Tax=Pseudonocardia sp. NPDC049154 TaxID=3155501 RepID=UPI003411EAA8